MPKLNLACGLIYVESSDWINVDWDSRKDQVLSLNLLAPLPFQDNFFDLIYSSHFIEHIERKDLELLLSECFRILKPGGVIRLVTPDLEALCRLYISELEEGNYFNSQYVAFEILDQCVRRTSGGNILFWDQLSNKSPDFANFMKSISGRRKRLNDGFRENVEYSRKTAQVNLRILYRSLKSLIQWKYSTFLINLLPRWFRESNVSMARPGELHKWLYDFLSLAYSLRASGFESICKLSHSETSFEDKTLLWLDVDSEGAPRKGLLSMFIEARKPSRN